MWSFYLKLIGYSFQSVSPWSLKTLISFHMGIPVLRNLWPWATLMVTHTEQTHKLIFIFTGYRTHKTGFLWACSLHVLLLLFCQFSMHLQDKETFNQHKFFSYYPWQEVTSQDFKNTYTKVVYCCPCAATKIQECDSVSTCSTLQALNNTFTGSRIHVKETAMLDQNKTHTEKWSFMANFQ